MEFTDDNIATVKRRIVDATMGLSTYCGDELKRRFKYSIPEREGGHIIRHLVQTLSQKDLHSMMHDDDCGLVVDGLWGLTDVVFPFAVYEAKKKSMSLKAAQNQVYHACRAYLAMLDDLARDPNNISEYQTEESHTYQMFAFVSCGSFWQVFVVWSPVRGCVSINFDRNPNKIYRQLTSISV